MTKNIFLTIIIAALLGMTYMSCDKNTHVQDVVLQKRSHTMSVGTTFTLQARVVPPNATDQTLIWSSSDPKVATVDGNGTITAIAEGFTVITAASNDDVHRMAMCGVKVIDLEIEMVLVEEGTFTMGCSELDLSNCFSEATPAHEVTLSSYQISKFPVTQKLWVLVMGYNPSYFGGDNLPVERVSWYDTQNFIAKLNEMTGKNYSLPTEAQWEFAARGGNKSNRYLYSGSNDLDIVAWHGSNSNYSTHPVGTKAPNELGIYDMSGNVYEWVNDWYENYTDAPQTNPQGPDYGSEKVARGGGWFSISYACSVFFRVSGSPYKTADYPGFRLVLPVSVEK